MVGKSVAKKEEIRAYLKVSKIGSSLKEVFIEISVVYRSTNVFFGTVLRWKKKFDSGLESIENAPKSGRLKFASCDGESVSKVKEIVERDARCTVHDIACMVCISLSRVINILKNILNVRNFNCTIH